MKKSISRLNPFVAKSLLSHESIYYTVHKKPSTFAHPKARMGCFANQTFTEGDEIEYYYGTLAYQNVVDACNARGAHREGVRVITREQFHTSAIKLKKSF